MRISESTLSRRQANVKPRLFRRREPFTVVHVVNEKSWIAREIPYPPASLTSFRYTSPEAHVGINSPDLLTEDLGNVEGLGKMPRVASIGSKTHTQVGRVENLHQHVKRFVA